MLLQPKTITQALNKAYLRETVNRTDIERFKEQLTLLFERAAHAASEDTLKDHITELLRNTWYNPHHTITINKERKDLAIHTGRTAADAVGVIAEIKKTGSAEMMSPELPNVKALHELVLYYLHERIKMGNNQIKYLLATDVQHWVLIDANEFDKKIYGNSRIKKLYEVYTNDKKDNPFFYDELKKILADSDEAITATYFNLDKYKKIILNANRADDDALLPLYKILSPAHLLKLPFANDSNSLDKGFYAELLHIIGLEERKEGSKKVIERLAQGHEASLLENTLMKLEDKDCLRNLPDATRYGITQQEQRYNIAIELCITWVNRILFLKLLEAQMYAYHQQNRERLFLNAALVGDFDELNNLFFQVLAEKPESRRPRLQDKFAHVPYLNSSLFVQTDLESRTIDIGALDNGLPLPLHPRSILKHTPGNREQAALPTLHYLFAFLDSYNFASEGRAEIQEDNKTLINASVLGLIFEKINGYKDGSFFTPGFITMYMCRQTLRRAVVQKFNEAKGWQCSSFEQLQDKIDFHDKEARQQANTIINSLAICDPAVGSGHFLVSALNELIAIKQDLKVLQYRQNGLRIKEYRVEVANDELMVQDAETELPFAYTLNQKGHIRPEQQALQETLFHEKETLIENCLFGVDINPNSVKICRLRLWIELLKNAYYTAASGHTQLETLPNIDINIKEGNSLISRFGLDADLGPTLEKGRFGIEGYKAAVQTYRNAQDKEEKREMETLIETIKNDFKAEVVTYDPINKKLSSLRGKLMALQQNDLFSPDTKKKNKANKELETLSKQIDKLDKEKADIQSSAIYRDAFEWRFEFPEVLDNEGHFMGFDVVIGNPPYVTGVNVKLLKKAFSDRFITAQYQIDLYVLFIEQSVNLLKEKGFLSLITPNSWLKNLMMSQCRKFILEKLDLISANPNISNAFEEASVDTLIFVSQKQLESKQSRTTIVWGYHDKIPVERWEIEQSRFWENDGYVFDLEVDESKSKIMKKVKEGSATMETLFEISRGINPYDSYTGQAKEIIESRAYHSDTKRDETFVPELKGRHVVKYGYSWDKKHFISYGDWLAAPREQKYFQGSRIVFREILGGKSFICSVIEEEFKIDRSLYIAIPKESVNVYFVQAVLASKLLAWFFRHEKNEFDALFPKIRVEEFRKLPIKITNKKEQFIELVKQIHAAKAADPQADTSGLEAEIDVLVYQLYGLTEEEIKMVEGT
jgi:adenine-specific DNA-methyltransferase